MRTRVMFFCLGNICRSPLAEALFRYHVEARGLGDGFEIASSGTSGYHVGEPPDPGSVRVARERLGLDISGQRAQQLVGAHVQSYDWLVAMDGANLRDARRLPGGDGGRLVLLRDYEPDASLRSRDVPDPWGGGPEHFERVFEMVERCTATLLDAIVAR
ncbi:low molecular weight phosphotyrosine protein phosphatase [Lujinxingia vulgaris]|uniref:protein-tyrosine-phosphatase n=1 Tax=Lujinxingia vulgaris TaxID=2600176 RepID=A0A5C6XPV9_9DELT|nr:low molecular weight phosphotyrosine protein phosphatase [Lujinxingia vulgaris]